MVTPVSSSVKEDSRRPSMAIPSTISSTVPAPASDSNPMARNPKQMPITAPTDPPLETPSVYGSARGSRSMHWNSTPVNDSAAPASRASRTRGKSRVEKNFVIGRDAGERAAELDVGAADQRGDDRDDDEDGERNPDSYAS